VPITAICMNTFRIHVTEIRPHRINCLYVDRFRILYQARVECVVTNTPMLESRHEQNAIARATRG